MVFTSFMRRGLALSLLITLVLLLGACVGVEQTFDVPDDTPADAASAESAADSADSTGEQSSSDTASDMGEGMTTESGLVYIEEVAGTGRAAEAGTKVSVHYTGMLDDGTVFDSSVERGQPIEFMLGVGQVIPGWDEGIALMFDRRQGSPGHSQRVGLRRTGRRWRPHSAQRHADFRRRVG